MFYFDNLFYCILHNVYVVAAILRLLQSKNDKASILYLKFKKKQLKAQYNFVHLLLNAKKKLPNNV